MGSISRSERVLDDSEVGVRGAGPAEGGEGAPEEAGVFAQSGSGGFFHHGRFVVRRVLEKSRTRGFVLPAAEGMWGLENR